MTKTICCTVKKFKTNCKSWTRKKIHGVIKFNQKEWLKTYIDLNTELQRNTKNNFEKYFDQLINNSVFGKNKENVRKSINIKLVNIDKRRKYLLSDPNLN